MIIKEGGGWVEELRGRKAHCRVEMSVAEKQWGEHILPKKVVFQNPKINWSYEIHKVLRLSLVLF